MASSETTSTIAIFYVILVIVLFFALFYLLLSVKIVRHAEVMIIGTDPPYEV
jgi:hypothetical protein